MSNDWDKLRAYVATCIINKGNINSSDIDDLVQEVLTRGFEKGREAFNGNDIPKAYFAGVVNFVVLEYWRKQKVVNGLDLDLESSGDAYSLRNALTQLLVSLTEDERDYYDLRMEGLNDKVIAKILKVTGRTIRRRKSDLRQKIRDLHN